MKYDNIQIKKNKDNATVILNRPELHNALNEQFMKELTNCFKDLSKDKNIRTIILTGNGKSFCAGADLNWMKSMVNFSKEENIKDSNLLLNLYDTIYNCPKPVICKVNGHAFGGGIGLFAVCDITFAIPECKFAFSEVKLGIIPSVISTFIAKRMTYANMRRVFLTGERFDSNYAKDIGLIDFLYPEDEIDEKISKYVKILHSSGPKAIVEVKNLIKNCQEMKQEKYKKFTVEKIAQLRISDEGQEGINAFLEKRKTKWSE